MIKNNPLFKAILVVAVTGVMAVSATLALSQDTATLTNSSINSASVDLTVDNPDKNGVGCSSTFDQTDCGFDFEGIIPGSSNVVYRRMNIRNNPSGPEPVDMRVSLQIDHTPASVVTEPAPSFPSTVDFTKTHLTLVQIDLENPANNAEVLSGTIASLITTPVQFNSFLASGAELEYQIYVRFDLDAFTGESASITDLDINLIGDQL